MENSKENPQPKNPTSMAEFFNTTTKKKKPSYIISNETDNKTPTFSQKAIYYENNKAFNGQLVLLDYVIYFFQKEPDLKRLRYNKKYFVIPLFSIKKLDATDYYKQVTIKTKDRRTLIFRTSNFNFYDTIKANAFPPFISGYHEFAIAYAKQTKELYQINGWNLFDLSIECLRMGISDKYKITDENLNYNLCETYPKYLIIPSGFSEHLLRNVAEFRALNRFPVLSYYYKYNGSCLWRSSQCLAGLTLKSSDMDKKYMNEISSITKKLVIYDARPYVNAIANSLKGAGIERKSDYDYCEEVIYCDIDNIPGVRDALKTRINVIDTINENDINKFYSKFEQTKWLDLVSSLLKTSVDIVNSILDGKTVLVHCSDGWDRTTQLCSLAQLLLDSYYRTLEGFCVLIEKEWVSFGHQFAIRCGNDSRKEKRKMMSPIFIQFLDVVYQIMNQCPTAFEFRTNLLTYLSDEIYSGKYGTFLFNNEKHINECNAKKTMISIWSEIILQRKNYYNPLYDEDKNPLNVSYDMPKMKLWSEFFFKYDKEGNENLILKSCLKNYNVISEMIKVLKDNQLYGKLTKDAQEYIKKNFT